MAERKRKGSTAPTVRVGGGTPSRRGPERLPDTEGDVGFEGGARPDEPSSGRTSSDPRTEPARPRDTGRQGS